MVTGIKQGVSHRLAHNAIGWLCIDRVIEMLAIVAKCRVAPCCVSLHQRRGEEKEVEPVIHTATDKAPCC